MHNNVKQHESMLSLSVQLHFLCCLNANTNYSTNKKENASPLLPNNMVSQTNHPNNHDPRLLPSRTNRRHHPKLCRPPSRLFPHAFRRHGFNTGWSWIDVRSDAQMPRRPDAQKPVHQSRTILQSGQWLYDTKRNKIIKTTTLLGI